MSGRRPVLWQALRVLVSAGLIAVILLRVSPARLAGQIRALDPAWLAGAVAVFLASSLLGSIQWHILLGAGGVPLPARRTVALYFTGLFFNNLLPTNIGGDVFKIYDVSRSGHDPHRVFAVTLLDRLFGITGLCLLAIIATAALLVLGHRGPLPLYLLIFAGCVAPVAILAASRTLSSRLRIVLGRIGLWGIGRRVELVLGHMGALRGLGSLLGRITLLTLTVQLLRIATHVAVARALGIVPGPTDLLYFYVFVPLLGLIMMLPISLNGLGVREGAGVLLFASIGLLEEQAFLMEFITYVVMVAVSLVGGVLFLRRQLRG
ncbi:MAG: lysylphosphatidylglycerol synthase transmembrane domain-containing protein [Candidatus Krumholzibacteria bacterium]|nr:lysylphosphatidylglycerol synthase transmembrane domain-containing protein [Candidatus Krumholzibacteria bacterium]